MKINNSKNLFIVTNTFSLLYFIFLIKLNKLNDYYLIINNEKNFFINGKFDQHLKENNIKYIVISWGKRRRFPIGIYDINIYI